MIKKKTLIMWFIVVVIILVIIYLIYSQLNTDNSLNVNISQAENTNEIVGKEEYNGFIIDNILHTETGEDIHYNVYIPDNYDGSEPYALYFTLPGYQGLYFQGVAKNIKTEQFGFVAQGYNEKMIIVAPQLDDWQETSANQTLTLVEYFIENYNIDTRQVYANGYSGGGETMSLVMAKRPDLFTAYLHCSSKWDGTYESVVENETPIYIAIGEDDEYYGSSSSIKTYEVLYRLYKDKGLSDERIDELLVLDIKDSQYFISQGVTNQHGGGAQLFAQDKDIMGWLFSQKK